MFGECQARLQPLGESVIRRRGNLIVHIFNVSVI